MSQDFSLEEELAVFSFINNGVDVLSDVEDVLAGMSEDERAGFDEILVSSKEKLSDLNGEYQQKMVNLYKRYEAEMKVLFKEIKKDFSDEAENISYDEDREEMETVLEELDNL